MTEIQTMSKWRFSAVLALSLLLVGQAADAGVRKSGLTGAAFLKIGVGARPVALGSSYTTVTGDANQLFYNPAGIALSSGESQVTLFHNQWIADLSHSALGFTRDMGDLGTVGIGLVSLGLSGIAADRDVVPDFVLNAGTFVPNDSEESDAYDYRDMALGVSWSRSVSDRLDLGVTGKMVRQSIDGESATAWAADFGAIYRIDYNNTRIGARINNLGSDLTFYDIASPLPLIFSVGASMDVFETDGTKVTVLADATKPQDAEQLVFSGVEVSLFDMLHVRTGYKLNYQGVENEKVDETTGAIFDVPTTEEGLSFGVGADVPVPGLDATVDYAYTDFGILDSVHRISVSLQF
jgi:hypothetical protein